MSPLFEFSISAQGIFDSHIEQERYLVSSEYGHIDFRGPKRICSDHRVTNEHSRS